VDYRPSRRRSIPAGGFLPLLALPGPRPSEKPRIIDHNPSASTGSSAVNPLGSASKR
jgi:hypothetical protein